MPKAKKGLGVITFKDLTQEQKIRMTVYNNTKTFLVMVNEYPLYQLNEDLISIYGLSSLDIQQIKNTLDDNKHIKITPNGIIKWVS